MTLSLHNTCFHLVRNTWLFQVTFPLKNNGLIWAVKCSFTLLFSPTFFNMKLQLKSKRLTQVLYSALFVHLGFLLKFVLNRNFRDTFHSKFSSSVREPCTISVCYHSPQGLSRCEFLCFEWVGGKMRRWETWTIPDSRNTLIRKLWWNLWHLLYSSERQLCSNEELSRYW